MCRSPRARTRERTRAPHDSDAYSLNTAHHLLRCCCRRRSSATTAAATGAVAVAVTVGASTPATHRSLEQPRPGLLGTLLERVRRGVVVVVVVHVRVDVLERRVQRAARHDARSAAQLQLRRRGRRAHVDVERHRVSVLAVGAQRNARRLERERDGHRALCLRPLVWVVFVARHCSRSLCGFLCAHGARPRACLCGDRALFAPGRPLVGWWPAGRAPQ
mmetsp:Transcript_3912/g.9350  ORF Transcript_3912/g.9350 Transcript_3912/m.9350 type:complete len:218 (-) Transcript_3912:3-656(-)